MTLSEHILCSYLISFLLTSVDLNRRRQWHPTPVLLPGKSHGWRILVGFNPWSRWELDMTERLYFHFWLSCIREGNGNPLHCSCLENLRDGGAWWAAIYGVAQSRTWLSDLAAVAAAAFLQIKQKIMAASKLCSLIYLRTATMSR